MVTPLWPKFTKLGGCIAASLNAVGRGRREFSRAVVDTKVTIYLQGRTFQGRLRDVSISGAMLEPGCGLAVGDEMDLELPHIPGRVKARVMRRVNDAIGVRFLNRGVGVLIGGWSRGTSTPGVAAARSRDGD